MRRCAISVVRVAMQSEPVESATRVVMPWIGDPEFLSALAKHIPFDAACVAIFPDKPHQPDEMLMAEGWPQHCLSRWIATDEHDDPLISSAKRRGCATMETAEKGEDFFRRYTHTMMGMFATSADHHRWWCLVTARDAGAFTQVEQQIAGLLLRCWHGGYDQIDEPGMGRLLIGHDDRVIHLDPYTELRFLQNPGTLEHLLGLLPPVVQQRWPKLDDGQTHDFAVEMAGNRSWVRFQRGRALEVDNGEHWYLEVRPLGESDLPTVGEVHDDRVARALAFLHDHYYRSPSLAEVAQFVRVSPFHFHRLFSKIVGISPKHYLQQKQLQVAKWRLRCSRVPIGTIAGQTGFASHGHFTSTFHRMVGVSPSQYREEAVET